MKWYIIEAFRTAEMIDKIKYAQLIYGILIFIG